MTNRFLVQRSPVMYGKNSLCMKLMTSPETLCEGNDLQIICILNHKVKAKDLGHQLP